MCDLRCMNTRLRLLCNKSPMAHQPEPRFKTALSYVTFLFSEWRIETNFSLSFFLSYVKGHKKLRKCLLPSFTIFYSFKNIKVQSYHNEYSILVSISGFSFKPPSVKLFETFMTIIDSHRWDKL